MEHFTNSFLVEKSKKERREETLNFIMLFF